MEATIVYTLRAPDRDKPSLEESVMHIPRTATIVSLAMAIGLLTAAQAPAGMRLGGGGGGGGFHGGSMFHGGGAPAFHTNTFHGFGNPAFADGRSHFAFDRHRGFDFRHRHFFFAGGPFFGGGYGYTYDCAPYWNGYAWIYPYGYSYSCGYPGYGASDYPS
jgi:hypothetical protein